MRAACRLFMVRQVNVECYGPRVLSYGALVLCVGGVLRLDAAAGVSVQREGSSASFHTLVKCVTAVLVS